MKDALAKRYHKQTTIGIDLGDRHSRVCVLDHETGEIEEFSISMCPNAFRERMARVRRARVVIECGTQSLWVGHTLMDLGFDLIVANPRNLALIAKSHLKTDRVDARMLAELGGSSLRLLQPVTLRSMATQRDLALMRVRDALVKDRTEQVNRLRMILKPFGIRIKTGTGRGMIEDVRCKSPDELVEVTAPLIRTIEHLNQEIRGLDRKIATLIEERYPQARLLMTVDGIGPITALSTVLTIDDPKRFKGSRSAGAYAGLAPGKFESGRIRRDMGITKTGSLLWRCHLINSAQYILSSRGKDCDLRRIGLEIASRGGPKGKRRAVVAVARRLAVMMHRMLIEHREFERLRFPERRMAFAA